MLTSPSFLFFFFFNDTATTEIYTLSLHDALPILPVDELEKARSLAKGRFVLGTESPQGLIMFGLRREVLEGEAIEPDKLLAELDAVTVEDVQRVAQDLIERDRMHLAVIGPFDDDQRFLAALG